MAEYPNIFDRIGTAVFGSDRDQVRPYRPSEPLSFEDKGPSIDTRAFTPEPPMRRIPREPTSFERAQGRGYRSQEDPIPAVAAQNQPYVPPRPSGVPQTNADMEGLVDRGTLLNPTSPEPPPAPAPRSANPWLQKPGGARFGGQTAGGYKTDPFNTAGAATNVAGGVLGGGAGSAAATGVRPDLFQHHPDDTHPASGEEPQPFQHHPDDTQPASGGQGTYSGTAGFTEPDVPPQGVTRPGKPSAPGGARGGAGGGSAGRGRLPLGDQRRTEAYDPTLDRADPRNIGIIDEQGRTNPKLREQAEKGAIDPTAPGVKTGEQAQRFTNQYTKALAGASAYMEQTFHQQKGDPNKAEGYHAMTYKATGAPDDKTVADVFKVVDPNNELTPKEKMELSTRAMHDWYTAHGDTKNADRVAAEMLQYGNKQAQAAGKQVLEASKRGDYPAAAQALKAAYDWLPDGMTADVKGNSLVITDSKGQVANSIPLDPKMVQNLGLGLATGTLFWDIVQQRAGKPGTFAPQDNQALNPRAPSGPSGGPPAMPPGREPWDEKIDPGPTTPIRTGASPAGSTAPPLAAGSPAGSPATQAAPPQPAQAPPPRPATGAGAPAAPPSSSGGPPTSPLITPQGTQQSNQPPPQVLPEEPRPPQNSRTEAPAPAAPGPAPIDQATGAPVVQGDKPPAVDANVPSTLKPDTKPPETKKSEPQGDLVWDDKDPDKLPVSKKTGKTNVVRFKTYPMSDEVKQAQKEIGRIRENYNREMQAQMEDEGVKGVNRKDKETNALMDKRKQLIKDQYKADMKEQDSIINEWRKEAKAHDAKEAEALKPHSLKGEERRDAIEAIDSKFADRVKEGKKWKMYDTNPLRLYNNPKKWVPLRDIVLSLKAVNDMPVDKLTDLTLTMMSHLNNDKNAEGESANGQIGGKGSRFLMWGEDLARNPVVKMGLGNSAATLSVPQSALNDIRRFRAESYGAANPDPNIVAEAARKSKIDYSTLMPGQLKKTTDMLHESATKAIETLPPDKRTMKPDAELPDDMGSPEQREIKVNQRRRAADRAGPASMEP